MSRRATLLANERIAFRSLLSKSVCSLDSASHVGVQKPLGPIQTNLHNRINVCIKNLIGSFPYAFAYRPINFFMLTFMRLCKFVWIGPYLCVLIPRFAWATSIFREVKETSMLFFNNRLLLDASIRKNID